MPGVGVGHHAQLGVDARAVEALVVVLHDQLPVGVQRVAVGVAHHQVSHPEGGQVGVEAGEVLLERWCVTADVRHHVAVPLLDRQRDQRVVVGVADVVLVRRRDAVELTVRREDPRVVRAADEPTAGLSVARQQLMGTVAAGVEEAAQASVGAPHDEDAFVADAVGASVAGLREGVGAPQTHPSPGEQVFVLPRQDVRVGVGGGGQHLAAAVDGRLQLTGGKRECRGRRGERRPTRHDSKWSRSVPDSSVSVP